MGINISGDDNDDIMFEVKGKISLSLTRKGIVYRGELVKDAGQAHRLMMEFLGLAEERVQEKAGEIVQLNTSPQERLDALMNQKQVMAIIQRSKTGEDDGVWESLPQSDIPSWVVQPEPMGDMITSGAKIQASDGEYWYRAVTVNSGDEVAH